MTLVRTPLGTDVNGPIQGTVGVRFVASITVLDTASQPLLLTGLPLAAKAFAPKDSSKPTVTITADSDQVLNKGRALIVIVAAELTAVRADPASANDWQLDLTIDAGNGPVLWRLATLPVDVSLAQ